MMNRFICIPLSLFLLSVCNPKKNERPNGWYYITDRVEDSISLEPIVAADCVEKWADATEHSIGKRIGFVFQDEVICTPCINCRIETGSFAISAQDTDIKSIYWQIVRKIHSR